MLQEIDLLAIQQKSLDRALFLYIFIREVRSSGVKASITIVHIRKFYKMEQSIVRLRFFLRIAKRSIPKQQNLQFLLKIWTSCPSKLTLYFVTC